jgi:hypothetical protein
VSQTDRSQKLNGGLNANADISPYPGYHSTRSSRPSSSYIYLYRSPRWVAIVIAPRSIAELRIDHTLGLHVPLLQPPGPFVQRARTRYRFLPRLTPVEGVCRFGRRSRVALGQAAIATCRKCSDPPNAYPLMNANETREWTTEQVQPMLTLLDAPGLRWLEHKRPKSAILHD